MLSYFSSSLFKRFIIADCFSLAYFNFSVICNNSCCCSLILLAPVVIISSRTVKYSCLYSSSAF
nr:MAG TPA: hypothetical protein [Caudoviricetes sp.]